MASMKGRLSLSFNVGSLSVPMTESSSACAFLWTPGWVNIAKKKICKVGTLFETTKTLQFRIPRHKARLRTVSTAAVYMMIPAWIKESNSPPKAVPKLSLAVTSCSCLWGSSEISFKIVVTTEGLVAPLACAYYESSKDNDGQLLRLTW